MSKQRTFASVAWQQKGKIARWERFLAEMDQVIPWRRLLALIEPHYPKARRDRPPLGLEKMLRIYLVQQWLNLSDPAAADALYASESIRRFVGVKLGDDVCRTRAPTCGSGISWRRISSPRWSSGRSGSCRSRRACWSRRAPSWMPPSSRPHLGVLTRRRMPNGATREVILLREASDK